MITGQYVNLTASGSLGQRCKIIGFYVNSTTSGTIVLKDGGSSGTTVSGTITPAIGWHFFPADCPSGGYATLANTINVTFVVQPY